MELSVLQYEVHTFASYAKITAHPILRAFNVFLHPETRELAVVKSKHAQVHFNDSGTPVADHFDDVYFSNDSGIDETQHVFICGNDLASRWQGWSSPCFVIAETGFGTGLNFLVAMREFNEFRKANPRHPLKHLFFITTEKYPLPQQDVKRALSAFPVLKEEAHALIEDYPMGLEGCHRLDFSAFSTTLDLWIGDVHRLLPQWHTPKSGLVDAWFLDGFAPSKNPDMWTDALFSQMARLSKTGTTLGTFTAAGIVKRGLASVGFTIEKRRGFGRKRDMLSGVFDAMNETVPSKLRASPGPYYRYNNIQLTEASDVIVVGSGLAAVCTCAALVKRGINTTLCFDGPTLATGASGNPQGGFYPQLHSEASIASRIQALSFLFAKAYYKTVVARHDNVAHDFCGVVQLRFNDKVAARQHKLVNSEIWPEALIRYVDSQEISDIANIALPYKGLFIEQGGWLSPGDLVNAIIADALETGKLTLKANHTYLHHSSTNQHSNNKTNVNFNTCNEETSLLADHLILCVGANAVDTEAFSSLPLRPVRGQVEAILSQSPISELKTVLCHKGYMTPSLAGRHALGSTYIKNDMNTQIREEETRMNLATHEQALSASDVVNALDHDGTARAAIRLGAPDHQPIVGSLLDFNALKTHYADLGVGKPVQQTQALPESAVSTLACLGSRGLTTAPLMAEILVSSLCHAPLPINNDLLNAVNTSRFMVRDAIRSE